MNRLLEYLPPYLREYREIKQITEVECPELDALREAVNRVMNEMFIDSLDEYGCERWERMLGIRAVETLELRRFEILSKLLQDLPYTLRKLHEVLTRLCGIGYYEVVLKHREYFIQIWVEVESMKKREIVIDTVKKMLPANLILNVEINYRSHGWLNKNRLTHRDLNKHTHNGVRIIIL